MLYCIHDMHACVSRYSGCSVHVCCAWACHACVEAALLMHADADADGDNGL